LLNKLRYLYLTLLHCYSTFKLFTYVKKSMHNHNILIVKMVAYALSFIILWYKLQYFAENFKYYIDDHTTVQ